MLYTLVYGSGVQRACARVLSALVRWTMVKGILCTTVCMCLYVFVCIEADTGQSDKQLERTIYVATLAGHPRTTQHIMLLLAPMRVRSTTDEYMMFFLFVVCGGTLV